MTYSILQQQLRTDSSEVDYRTTILGKQYEDYHTYPSYNAQGKETSCVDSVRENGVDRFLFIKPAGFTKEINVFPPYDNEYKEYLEKPLYKNRQDLLKGLFELARLRTAVTVNNDYPFGSSLEVRLVPEPGNPYDSNAILMVLANPANGFYSDREWIHGQQIGYVPKVVNQAVLRNLKNIKFGVVASFVTLIPPYQILCRFRYEPIKPPEGSIKRFEGLFDE